MKEIERYLVEIGNVGIFEIENLFLIESVGVEWCNYNIGIVRNHGVDHFLDCSRLYPIVTIAEGYIFASSDVDSIVARS